MPTHIIKETIMSQDYITYIALPILTIVAIYFTLCMFSNMIQVFISRRRVVNANTRDSKASLNPIKKTEALMTEALMKEATKEEADEVYQEMEEELDEDAIRIASIYK